MSIFLTIFFRILVLVIAFLLGVASSYSVGWDAGRKYALKIYDPKQFEYEESVRAAKRHKL